MGRLQTFDGRLQIDYQFVKATCTKCTDEGILVNKHPISAYKYRSTSVKFETAEGERGREREREKKREGESRKL